MVFYICKCDFLFVLGFDDFGLVVGVVSVSEWFY